MSSTKPGAVSSARAVLGRRYRAVRARFAGLTAPQGGGRPTRSAARSGYTEGVPGVPIALSLEELPGPACWLAAPEGRVAEHNARFAAWAGRASAAEATLAELFPGDPSLAALWEEARMGGVIEHHVTRRGPDGAPSLWSVRAQRTRDGVLVSAVDLGAFAAAARALHGIQAGYVTAATHEARAPLAAIKAWASALLSRRRGESLAEDGLAAIARQVDRMNDLLSDLFEAARASSGALTSVRAPVPIRDLVERALVGSPAAASVTIGPGAHDLVLVDVRQIEAAIARVVEVAARRTPGGVAVTVERGVAELFVTAVSPGPPLSPAARASLFARAKGRRLHAARLLAAGSGGRVFHEGGDDGGRFVLALPTAVGASPPRAPGPLRVAAAVREEGDLRVRASAIFELFGHQVSAVSLEAALASPSFDVLLLDASLAGPAGVAEAIGDRRDGRLILVTAPPGAPAAALVGAERAGAAATLPEPIDWAELLALVQITAADRGAC